MGLSNYLIIDLGSYSTKVLCDNEIHELIVVADGGNLAVVKPEDFYSDDLLIKQLPVIGIKEESMFKPVTQKVKVELEKEVAGLGTLINTYANQRNLLNPLPFERSLLSELRKCLISNSASLTNNVEVVMNELKALSSLDEEKFNDRFAGLKAKLEKSKYWFDDESRVVHNSISYSLDDLDGEGLLNLAEKIHSDKMSVLGSLSFDVVKKSKYLNKSALKTVLDYCKNEFELDPAKAVLLIAKPEFLADDDINKTCSALGFNNLEIKKDYELLFHLLRFPDAMFETIDENPQVKYSGILLDLGHDSIRLRLFNTEGSSNEKVVDLSERIGVDTVFQKGGYDLVNSIAKELDLTLKEAEIILQQNPFLWDESTVGEQKEAVRKAYAKVIGLNPFNAINKDEVFLPWFVSLFNNLKNNLENFRFLATERAYDIILCGGLSEVKGLKGYISKALEQVNESGERIYDTNFNFYNEGIFAVVSGGAAYLNVRKKLKDELKLS